MSKNTKVITGLVRLAYPNLFEAKAINGSIEQFSTVIVISKTDLETIDAINKAIKFAEEAGKKKFGESFVEYALKKPLRDGDKEAKLEMYKGSVFLNAKNTNKPQVVDRKLQTITDKKEIYSGVYAKASLYFYPYNKRGNRGIACGLGNIQKIKDGESFGLYCSAASEFTIIDEEMLF